MSRKPVLRLLILSMALVIASVPMATDARPQGSMAAQAHRAKVGQLLAGSGYNYKAINETVWTIKFTATSLESYEVILASSRELLVIFVTIARKPNIPLTADLLCKLLHLNHDFDSVKIGLDNDGGAFVRMDVKIRLVDARELKEAVHPVAAASDEVFAGIKPDLTK